MHTLSISQPEELIILIPHLLGYQPRNHLIMLSTEPRGSDATGRHACFGPVVAIDMAEVSDMEQMAKSLNSVLERCHVKRGVLVYYQMDSPSYRATVGGEEEPGWVAKTDGERTPGFDMMAILRSFIQGRGFHGYIACQRGWIDVSKPQSVQSWDELNGSQLAAALVYSGSAPLGKSPGKETAYRNESDRSDAYRAGVQWIDSHAEDLEDAGCRLWTEILSLESVGVSELSLELAGEANAAIALDGVRDRVLVHALAPGGALPLESLSNETLSARLSEILELRPAVAQCEGVRRVLDSCAQLARADDPHALAASAYVSWWMGSNSIAAVRVKEALAADPTHNLARLLHESLARHVLPPWADHALSS